MWLDGLACVSSDFALRLLELLTDCQALDRRESFLRAARLSLNAGFLRLKVEFVLNWCTVQACLSRLLLRLAEMGRRIFARLYLFLDI